MPQFPKMLNPLIFVKCLEIFQRKALNANNKLLYLLYISVIYTYTFLYSVWLQTRKYSQHLTSGQIGKVHWYDPALSETIWLMVIQYPQHSGFDFKPMESTELVVLWADDLLTTCFQREWTDVKHFGENNGFMLKGNHVTPLEESRKLLRKDQQRQRCLNSSPVVSFLLEKVVCFDLTSKGAELAGWCRTTWIPMYFCHSLLEIWKKTDGSVGPRACKEINDF